MGVIESTIRLKNQMTPILNSVTSAMNMVISSAYDVKEGTKNMFDTTSLDKAKQSLADAEIAIRQMEKQQSNFNDELKESNNHASKLGGLIKSAVTAYVGFKSVKAFVGLSDEMTSIKARLDSINDGHQSTLKLQDMVFDSAQRSRGEYKMTMDIVSRLGAQAKNTFKTNQETIAFAENLNKLFTISGTSAQGMESVMYNLTQAMASGVLRGQDLNAVISNTPQLLDIVAKYMGTNIGQIRKLAEEGQLSADVIKNALLGASTEINEKLKEMPHTFGQIANNVKNRFIKELEPAMQRFNDLLNSKRFNVFVNHAIQVAISLANVIGFIVDAVILLSNVIADNWDYIAPLVWGIVSAVVAWQVATAILTLKQQILNTTLLSNPIFFIIAGIVALLPFLYKWIQEMGGVAVAWLWLKNTAQTVIDFIVLHTKNGVHNTLTSWENFKIGVRNVTIAVQNFFGTMVSNVLSGIQNMVNGAIDLINKFIGLVNNVPGVDINPLGNVTFGDKSIANHNANVIKRQQELDKFKNDIEKERAKRTAEINGLATDYAMNRMARKIEVEQAKASALKEKERAEKTKQQALDLNFGEIPDFSSLPSIADSAKKAAKSSAGTKKNTDKLKDGIEVKSDDIKYLKDLAEMRAIQNFSFEKIEVTANNSFGDVHETADLDGWMDNLTDNLANAVNATMGGVPAYEQGI